MLDGIVSIGWNMYRFVIRSTASDDASTGDAKGVRSVRSSKDIDVTSSGDRLGVTVTNTL